MKILLYSLNYSPELTGIGKYSGEMASWLAKSGHDVRVIAAPPYYPNWQVSEGYRSWAYQYQLFDGVKVWRCPIFVPKKLTGLKRILHLASFALSSIPVLVRQLFWRPNVIICVEPPFFCAPFGVVFSRLVGAKSLLHIQDFEIDAAINLGLMPSFLPQKLIYFTELRILRRFDAVSSISRSMLKKLDGVGVHNSRHVFFPNWSNLTQVSYDVKAGQQFRELCGVHASDYLILYSGNMGEKQGLELVVEAASEMSDMPAVKFLLCGDGVSRERIEKLAESKNLDNISFLPLQPVEIFNKLLNSADVHLVVQKAGAADLVMPSKLTNIIATGGYSVVTAEASTELGVLLAENEFLGSRVEPDNLAEFVSTLRTLSRSKMPMDHAKIRGFAENNFEMNIVMSRFEKDLQNLVDSKKQRQHTSNESI